jgi:hypothetical protein
MAGFRNRNDGQASMNDEVDGALAQGNRDLGAMSFVATLDNVIIDSREGGLTPEARATIYS